MADADLARKLLIKSGHRVLVLNDPGGYADRLAAPDVELATAARGVRPDVGLVFAVDRAALQTELARILPGEPRPGVLWVAYRKLPRSDLNRNGVLELTQPFGWTPVTQVAIDEAWSAMRIRPLAEVGR